MRIFILEDDPARIQMFRETLLEHEVTLAMDVDGATKAWCPPYDLMLLDHDLGGEQMVSSSEENTGSGFCRWLTEYYKDLGPEMIPYTLIHSYNFAGADWMHRWLTDFGAEAQPFPFGLSLLTALKGFITEDEEKKKKELEQKEREQQAQQQTLEFGGGAYWDPDTFF